MAKRDYPLEEKTIKSLASRYPAVVITGPRGYGKSALARQAFPSKNVIDLSNASILEIARKSPKTFLLAFPSGAIIKEAQNLPKLMETIRFYIDKWGYEPGRYILVSSKELDLSQLQDRGVNIKVIGQSMEDIRLCSSIPENPFHFIHKGQNPTLDPQRTYSTIVQEIMEKDLSQHMNATSRQTFLDFFRNCAKASAKDLSMNRLARESNVSAPTVKTWLTLLQDYNIITKLESHEKTNSPRLFFNDSGLLCHMLALQTKEDLILSPHKDSIVFSYAVSELIKGRTSKAQEHNLALEGNVIVADWRTRYRIIVEPYVDVTHSTLERAHKEQASHYEKTVILHFGDVTYTQDQIDCIGYRDWARFASGMDYFS